MYLYETHLHTSPVSRCASRSAKETVAFYKSIGYAGIFITNHFLDGNIDIDPSLPYEDRIRFYFADYEEGVLAGQEMGLPVFCGVELSYKGTDFLVYGLDKEWYLAHPEIEAMEKTTLLTLMAQEGALIIQAHPFREDSYIDHIRLYPRHVHGIEIYNACRSDFENEMAKIYAQNYKLIPFAGSDNHHADEQHILGGMQSETPIRDEADFIERVKCGDMVPFRHTV